MKKMIEDRVAFFDIETYATTQRALVLSFGMVIIDPSERLSFDQIVKRGIEIKFDKGLQIKRDKDEDTVQWWASQGPRARVVTEQSPQDILPMSFNNTLSRYVSLDDSRNMLWFCRGPHFDAAIIEDFCHEFNQEIPWHFKYMRDMRTWQDFYNLKVQHPRGMVPHSALHDAAFEAYQYQHIETGGFLND